MFFMGSEVLGEIYATQGGLLNPQMEAVQPIILNYLQNVEKAGREILIVDCQKKRSSY